VPVLATTKIGRHYRTTVPREVRKLLGIDKGDGIEWMFENGKVIVRKVGNVVKCPFCGYDSEFKEVRAPWKFGFYIVKMFECPRCRGVFNYYHGISPRTGKVLEFVIRVRPKASGGAK